MTGSGDDSSAAVPRAGVIGWPIKHSRSPLIHGHWLRRYGIAGSYEKVAVEPGDLAGFLAGLAAAGWRGCNVTVPHKEKALALADEATDAARAIGAANTLWVERGRLHATNTDAYGFMTHLRTEAPGWQEGGRPALVLGAGGAARAIAALSCQTTPTGPGCWTRSARPGPKPFTRLMAIPRSSRVT